jgi:Polyketide cyclase / dehydrase and lipid transport
MFLFECAVTFEAEARTVWQIWTDVARWPEWDVSKEIAQMDGEFQPGTSGWVKKHNALGGTFAITSVEPGRRWISESPLPLGRVIFDHVVDPLPGGQVRVAKSVQVEGGSAGLFRVLAAPRMRRDIETSLAALQRRAQAQDAQAEQGQAEQGQAEQGQAEQAQAEQVRARQARAEQQRAGAQQAGAAPEPAGAQPQRQASRRRRTPHVA